MSWHDAFLAQARSENRVRRLLNGPDIEYSHRLHYLQMMTEKLAKGMLTGPDDREPPPAVHNALVRLLQTLKGRPDLRKRLGYSDASVFRAFINSILELASRIEGLAPSNAGITAPNPEYPWRDPVTMNVIAPVEHAFDLFDARSTKMIKFERLIEALLRIAE